MEHDSSTHRDRRPSLIDMTDTADQVFFNPLEPGYIENPWPTWRRCALRIRSTTC